MPSRPGPSVADNIWDVSSTRSPTRTPWVSSKICKSARWPCTRSTSPLRLALPVCTKAMAFFISGASLSTPTMFPVTPTTRASGVDVGILTQSLCDKCFKNSSPALGLQLLPVPDDVPPSDVKNYGFEAEGIILRPFLQVRPRRPQYILPVEGQQIPLGEQPLGLRDPAKDLAQLEVGLVEVATDVVKPLAHADRRQTNTAATTPQRHRDHAHVHDVCQDVAHQRIGDVVHQGVVALHHSDIAGVCELLAPSEHGQHSLDLRGILWLEHAQASLQPFEGDGQPLDVKARRQCWQATDEHVIAVRPPFPPLHGITSCRPLRLAVPGPARPPPHRAAGRETAAACAAAATG